MIMFPSSSDQDFPLSRERRGFDSRREHQKKPGISRANRESLESNQPGEYSMLAIGPEELGDKLGKTITCPHCGREHDIVYGTTDGVENRSMSFYRCGDKSYLGGIDGRAVKFSPGGVAQMTKQWRDVNGNKCTLRQLVIKEPDWAVSRITVGKYSQNDVDSMLEKQRRMCADAVTKQWNTGKFDQITVGLALRNACLNAGESDGN